MWPLKIQLDYNSIVGAQAILLTSHIDIWEGREKKMYMEWFYSSENH